MRHVKRQAVVVVLLALSLAACGATIRDNIRKSALVVGEAALTIDQLERDLYATGAAGYSAEKHKQAGAAIIVMLTAVRSYERAAAAWPEAVAMPTTVPQAMVDALLAIATVEKIIEGIPGNEKLLANLAKVKLGIGGGQ